MLGRFSIIPFRSRRINKGLNPLKPLSKEQVFDQGGHGQDDHEQHEQVRDAHSHIMPLPIMKGTLCLGLKFARS
jgi:hypothetical protein